MTPWQVTQMKTFASRQQIPVSCLLTLTCQLNRFVTCQWIWRWGDKPMSPQVQEPGIDIQVQSLPGGSDNEHWKVFETISMQDEPERTNWPTKAVRLSKKGTETIVVASFATNRSEAHAIIEIPKESIFGTDNFCRSCSQAFQTNSTLYCSRRIRIQISHR